jgi:hypothetical protein
MEFSYTHSMRSRIGLTGMLVVVCAGCHWIFPYEKPKNDPNQDSMPREEIGRRDKVNWDVRAKIDGLAVCKPECSGNTPICCNKGSGFGCNLTSENCVCETSTGKPCAEDAPICCNKGSGPSCHLTSENCTCDPVTRTPCAGNTPICCNKGNGSSCHLTSENCICDPSTGKPCAGDTPICCNMGNGTKCYSDKAGCL